MYTKNMKQTARHKKKQLLIELPEDSLPVCFCDSLKISQALAILIDNALAYVPEGGMIRLSARQEAASVSLFVADNGPGIPDSEKEAVFQRFYRSDTSRNDKQHFGLGLCIAKEICTSSSWNPQCFRHSRRRRHLSADSSCKLTLPVKKKLLFPFPEIRLQRKAVFFLFIHFSMRQ